ncbi:MULTISPECIES: LysR substrate-binding domain-containing protein [unclassified Lentilitoribacter]|uniref:LysR substrate-binding domain-containing protein n=1 Tax=unclassified Lentilitoribacter TaxID=2647570 RepID=UPI0013A6F054|nr:LysR substrate-binding domain-containing protein [Lentilitoribacter sp. Alg239-R112]
MDTKWLEDFVSFAHHLNFTKAANERNITQSAFSRRIRSLELWVGADLVDRRSFPALLSRAGKEFLPIAKELLQNLQRGREEVRQTIGIELDTLRFAAPHSISIHNLMPLLSELGHIIPNLKTRVTSDNLYNCCDHLSEQNSDFLVCYRSPDVALTLDEERFQFIEIGADRLVPVLSASLYPSFVEAEKKPLPYLCYSTGSFLGLIVDKLIDTKQPNLFVRHTDAFSESLKSLCLQGAGIAWLSEAAIKSEIARKELIVIGEDDWQVDLKLVIYTEPTLHTAQSKIAWNFFSKIGQ